MQHAAGPAIAIQHPMVVLEVDIVSVAHHPQDRGDGALTENQQGTHHQQLHPLKHPLREH